jgi:RNA polymerase sigma-B factor
MRFYKKYGQQMFEEIEAKRILFGFCRNVYREWVREQVKQKRADFLDNYDYESEDEAVEHHTLDESLESLNDFSAEPTEFEKRMEEQRKVLIEALRQLNPRVREVLECRFFHNMTRKQISEKMGISEKDVHTYQKRGIKYLKKMINGEEADE